VALGWAYPFPPSWSPAMFPIGRSAHGLSRPPVECFSLTAGSASVRASGVTSGFLTGSDELALARSASSSSRSWRAPPWRRSKNDVAPVLEPSYYPLGLRLGLRSNLLRGERGVTFVRRGESPRRGCPAANQCSPDQFGSPNKFGSAAGQRHQAQPRAKQHQRPHFRKRLSHSPSP